MVSHYNKMSSEVPEFKELFTLEEYMDTCLQVSSRQFSLYINGLPDISMVPVADMLNHASEPNVEWKYVDKLQGVQVVANREIKRGEEILMSYGNSCNWNYLVGYGFVLPNN